MQAIRYKELVKKDEGINNNMAKKRDKKNKLQGKWLRGIIIVCLLLILCNLFHEFPSRLGDLHRIKWDNHGCKSTVWRCVSRVLKKSSGIDCPARTIHEEVLQAAVVTAVNDAWSRKNAILPELRENIREVLEEDTDSQLGDIDAAIKQKQVELLDAGKDQTKIDEIGDVIMKLREERQNILTEAAMRKDVKDRIEDLSSFLGEQTEAITEYSEALVRRLIERITILDDMIVVEFKSGLEVQVEA